MAVFSRFFIDRPIFAWVIAIVLMLAGVLAINILPIAQYPTIAQPAITITTSYPGASARTLEDTVTQVIEQKMKGLDRLAYIASTSESTGTVTVTLTFETGTNPDTAQVQVQNKLALATPLLPQEVQQQGVAVNKAGSNFLAVLGFISSDGQMGSSDLADYVASKVQDPLSRIDGVGDTQLFGSQYAMRIWMDPAKLDSYKLTPLDVKSALQAQNAQISAGQLGGLPAVPGQQLNASITSQTRLKSAAEFENIVLRVQTDGSLVRLSDVARVERGSESYTSVSEYNGRPAAGLLIKLATGANALQTVKALDARVEELKPFFPSGMQVVKPYDTTPFVRLSIEEVVKTLIEAVVLVFLVMYLFLQNWRATLIPTIAVPVVLLGTFAVLLAFGYTINTLTMLAMVLAIGLLVDDAIVVVENVERVMAEEGLSPLEATRKSMDQITGALVGVALVLAAVFLPMAFFGGSSGVIYRQFSVTIISAMTLSVLVALVLTPALCATLLKPVEKGGHGAEGGSKKGFFGRLSGSFFGGFNRGFDRTNGAYQGAVRHIIGRKWIYLLVYAVLVAAVAFGFIKLPAGFLPDEDQGTLYTLVQLPPGATQERTLKVLKDIQHHYLVEQKDAVDSLFTVAGFSFAGGGQNSGFAFVKLKPWKDRTTDALKSSGVVATATKAFSGFRDGRVFAIAPPPVSELGNATGFDLMLLDRANLGHDALVGAQMQLLGALSQEKGLVGVRPNGQSDEPQFKVTIDFDKAGAYGLSVADINDTFSTAWGSAYVNDYIDDGRVKKVFLQADAPFRMLPSDVDRWRVRNSAGAMVPFSSFANVGWEMTSPRLERYNGVPSRELLGMALPGSLSSSQALDLVEQKVKGLPPGIGFEWTGISRQERESSGQALLLYGISLLVVFLCLAALYESWSIPAAVLLAVPLGVLGTLVFAFIFFKLNDIYFQVGLLTTVGLTAKNAILIVEFARNLQAEGEDIVQSALHAARQRLRPIIMTSLAFILGVLPLALGGGAGSGAQSAIGWSVIGGMLFGTVLAVVFVPLFFVVVRSGFGRGKGKDAKDAMLQLPAPDGTQAIALPGSRT